MKVGSGLKTRVMCLDARCWIHTVDAGDAHLVTEHACRDERVLALSWKAPCSTKGLQIGNNRKTARDTCDAHKKQPL